MKKLEENIYILDYTRIFKKGYFYDMRVYGKVVGNIEKHQK